MNEYNLYNEEGKPLSCFDEGDLYNMVITMDNLF